MWTKEQRLAIDEFGQNILVSAGAGSGKTAVLTSRILKHLSNMNIDELLVLTFTEAAAQEMKERVRNNIIKENLMDQLSLLDQAYITTFDSFNLSVVKKYHYLVNVKRNISIADGSMMILYKEQLITELFEELYETLDKDFVDMMKLFTFKNDDTIKKLIININYNLDLKYDKREYLKNYIKNNYNKKHIESLINEYIDLLNEELYSIYQLSNEFIGFGYDKMNVDYSLLNDFCSERRTYEEIKDFFDFFKFPRMTPKADELAKEINKNVKAIAAKLNKKLIYSNNELFECINQTKQFTFVLVDIILKFDDKITLFKTTRDLYEFNDIAKLALRLVSEFDVVKNDMKSKFKEILVDEYQDTSDLQEQFISAISNNNVYCVGDIKQSIYRFRNANPYIFQNKYLDYKNKKDGMKIDLLKNFRSREEVLNNINLIFEDMMSIKHGAADYRDGHVMIPGNANYNSSSNNFYNMDILTYTKDEYKNDEYEAFIISNTINEYVKKKVKVLGKDNKLRNCTYSDFAVLVDRATEFDLFRKVLSYNQIPVSVYKEEVLTSSVILKIISNLLNLVVNFYNTKDNQYKFSYASISRSFLTEDTDNDLLKDILNECSDTFISNTIKEIGFKINTISPLNIYYELIEKFDIYNKLIKIDNIKNNLYHLEYLHDIISNLSNSGYDIHLINTYFKDILSNNYDLKVSGSVNNNGVKIMTIHKSKGLEFPFVFMCGLQKKFNNFELKEFLSYDADYGIVTPYFNNGLKENFIKNLIVKKYIEEDISEKIRLFYVALTRAREKLIFVCSSFEDNVEKELSNINCFKDMLFYNYDKLDSYIKKIEVSNITKDYNITKEKNYKKFIKKDNKEIIEVKTNFNLINKHKISKELENVMDDNLRKNIDFGLRLHQILETIDFNKPDISLFDLSKQEKEIIEEILNLEVFKLKGEYYQELEFIYDKDNESFHGIIDLLVITNKEVYIIDYKLKNVLHDEYKEQLNRYKDYISTITNKPIKMYLLSILNKELTEVL